MVETTEAEEHQNGRFTQAAPEGGVILHDEGGQVTKVIKDVIWKIGASLMKGKVSDLMKIGTPAYIHMEKSYLHMVTKDISFYEHFMREAMTKSDDPVWKLKNINMAMLVALHLAVETGTKSPLNPILGETLMQQTEAGTRVYCEQTSHHPPISHFLIEGPPDCPFSMSGYVEYKVQVKGAFTSVHVTTPGVVKLVLPDSTEYNVEYPVIEVEGLLGSVKTLNVINSMTLVDVTNHYELKVDFDINKNKRSSGLMSYFSAKPKTVASGAHEHRRDLLSIKIEKVAEDNEDERETVASAKGSYLENIKYEEDEEPIWQINSKITRMRLAEPDPKDLLPSDSSLRKDSIHLIAQEWDESEAAKHAMEEQQRDDKKRRADAELARESK